MERRKTDSMSKEKFLEYYKDIKERRNSKVKGYCKRKNGSYRAYIYLKGKRVNLGTYKTEEEARAAYLKKRNECDNRSNLSR